jgi:UDP-GlcNAc3NAcA epimerase
MEDASRYFFENTHYSTKELNLNLTSADKYILVTFHREENTDNTERLINIINALNILSKDFRIILPLHPRTQKIISQSGLKLNFDFIQPVGYFEMLKLINNASLVITDSGGLQKEAFFFRKYCITLREETEWIELVDNGYNYLTGADVEKITQLAEAYFDKIISNKKNLYGNGKASQFITKVLSSI